jgi:hypothetical protein
MPEWLETPLDEDAKKFPNDWYVLDPSAVWMTIRLTADPPRLE